MSAEKLATKLTSGSNGEPEETGIGEKVESSREKLAQLGKRVFEVYNSSVYAAPKDADTAEIIGLVRERRQEQRNEFAAKRMETEQQLGERLTSVEEIVAAAETGFQADKRELEYDGRKVPVYDMKGYPITILSHDIGFKAGSPNRPDGVMARLVLEHPEAWLEPSPTRGEFVRNQEAARAYEEPQIANTLSASYFDSKSMSRHIKRGEQKISLLEANLRTETVRYAFTHVRANSLYNVSNRDAGTPAFLDDEVRGRSGQIDFLNELENSDFAGWNEVGMLRYDEQGNPILPDYVVTLDGTITQDTLRHAAFFGVPVVNVESQYYEE